MEDHYLGIIMYSTILGFSLHHFLFVRSKERKITDWFFDIFCTTLVFLFQPMTFTFFIQHHLTFPAPLIGPEWIAPQIGTVIAFVFYEYFLYWNHRMFHQTPVLYNLFHRVHHSPTYLDPLNAGRSSAWIIFIFFNQMVLSFFTLLILPIDPKVLNVFLALGGFFAIWQHTQTALRPNAFLRAMSYVFVTPHVHHWHHGTYTTNCNYGFLLSIFDRFHNTFYIEEKLPTTFGEAKPPGHIRQFFALWGKE